MTEARGKGVVRVLRLALAAFPRDFRRRYGPEMLEAASERHAKVVRERGRVAGWFHGARVVVDLLANGLAERLGRLWGHGGRHPVRSKSGSMDALLLDLRYGFRLLRRRPGFTLVAVATLGLGIGASSAMFTLVNQVAIRPLPFPAPDRLVHIYDTNVEREVTSTQSSPATFLDWRDQLRGGFVGVAAHVEDRATWSGVDPAESIRVAQVSGDWFTTLAVAPAIGRWLARDDETPGQDQVVVLSHGFWERRLGADSAAVGQTLPLDGKPYTIVGVMPQDFAFPSSETELWLPLSFHFDVSTSRGVHYLSVIGRLASGTTLASAEARLKAVTGRLVAAHQDQMRGWGAGLEPLKDAILGDLGSRLWLFLAAVALLLLVAWVNVANLFAARATAHGRELAVRVAVGADRWRLTRLLVVEGVVIASAAGVLALGVAWGVLRAVLVLAPKGGWTPTMAGGLSLLDGVTIDGGALAFAIGLSVLLGAGLGLVSALRLTRAEVAGSLRADTRGAGGTAGGHRLQQTLVVAQIALAMVLAVGAGLLIRSLMKLVAVDPGFQAEHGLVTTLSMPEARYPDQASRRRFLGEVVERLDRLPGVDGAAVALQIPLEGYGINFAFWVGAVAPPRTDRPSGDFRLVSPDYFRVMGIPVRRGRAFGPEDRAEAPRVAIVNETLVRQFFGDRDPIGQSIHVDAGDDEGGRVIVGVVGDVRQRGPSVPPSPAFYLPVDQLVWGTMRVVVRTSRDPIGLIEPLRREVAALDPLMAVRGTKPLAEHVAAAVGSPRFNTFLLGAFAVLALLLATAGIYALTSFLVVQRTHEIGVRLALGERPGQIRRAMTWAGIRLSLVGIVLGAALAALASRALAALLYGVRAIDVTSYVAAATLFLIVACLGSAAPARRASGVDPLKALRADG